jgi:protein TonB
VVAQKPLPQPPDPPPPPPVVQEVTPAPPAQPAAPSAAPAASAPAPVTGSPPPSAASGDLSTATPHLGPAGPGTDTIGELIRHLEAHRRYPAQARRRGIEGTVGLAFCVAAEGDLLSAEVRQPSGSRLLDRAALRTLERAFPLPPHLARRLAGEELTLNLAFRLVDP